MNNPNEAFKKHEFIQQCLKNIRTFFPVDRISNCEMVDHQKVCRVTLTQSVLRDRKNEYVHRELSSKLSSKLEFNTQIHN